MIQRKPSKRLGYNGPEEVKGHPWLTTFAWEDLANRKIKSPFIPKVIDNSLTLILQNKEDNFDSKNINEEWRDQDSDKMKENTLLLRRNSVQNLFNGYYYDNTIAAIAGEKMSQIYALNQEEGPSQDDKLKPKSANNTSEITTKVILSKQFNL